MKRSVFLSRVCMSLAVLLFVFSPFFERTVRAQEAGEMVTVKMMLYPPGCSRETFDRVLEEINRRLRSELQLQLQVDFVESGQQELTRYLMETPDADLIYVSDFQDSVRNQFFLPLDDLLSENGQGILEILPEEYLETGKMNGIQYGLVRNIEMCAAKGLVMRSDLLEKYEIDADQLRSWEDVEQVLAVIREHEADVYGVVADMALPFDALTDGMAVLEEENGCIVNFYESRKCREWFEMLYRWGEKGYLYDLENYRYPQGRTRPFLYQLMQEGRLFSYMVNYKPGIAVQEEQNCGMAMTEVRIDDPVMNASHTGRSQWGIYSGSSHPGEAMQILNFLYTDKEINDLFCNGTEGEEGYLFNRNWMLPNGYCADEGAEGQESLTERVAAFNQGAVRSPALGFWFDNKNVVVETEACEAVVEKYLPGFLCGRFDPEKMLSAMCKELKESGIDVIVEEKQRQYDEWQKAEKEK